MRPQPAEQGWTKYQTCQQLADDSRLPSPLHDLAEPAPDEHEQRNLGYEHGVTRPAGYSQPTTLLARAVRCCDDKYEHANKTWQNST
jgi:hypothetical protein